MNFIVSSFFILVDSATKQCVCPQNSGKLCLNLRCKLITRSKNHPSKSMAINMTANNDTRATKINNVNIQVGLEAVELSISMELQETI